MRGSLGRRTARIKGIGKNLAMPPSDPDSSGADRDVLTSLPRTRPTRRSAKRDRPARATPASGAGAGTTPPEDPAAAAATDTPARARRREPAKAKPEATTAARAKAAGPRAKAAAKPRAASATATRRRTGSTRATAAAAAAPTAESRSETTVPPAGYATEPPPASGRRGPDPFALVTTAVQAAGEIAQIGATLWSQAVRSAISRLPKP